MDEILLVITMIGILNWCGLFFWQIQFIFKSTEGILYYKKDKTFKFPRKYREMYNVESVVISLYKNLLKRTTILFIISLITFSAITYIYMNDIVATNYIAYGVIIIPLILTPITLITNFRVNNLNHKYLTTLFDLNNIFSKEEFKVKYKSDIDFNIKVNLGLIYLMNKSFGKPSNMDFRGFKKLTKTISDKLEVDDERLLKNLMVLCYSKLSDEELDKVISKLRYMTINKNQSIHNIDNELKRFSNMSIKELPKCIFILIDVD